MINKKGVLDPRLFLIIILVIIIIIFLISRT